MADKLKTVRERHGWSLADVAERTGLSRGYIHALEKGQAKRPGAEAIRRLEDLVGPLLLPAEQDPPTPEGLAELTRRRHLPPSEVRALAGVRVNGRQPQSVERWEFIYNALVMSESMDSEPDHTSSEQDREG